MKRLLLLISLALIVLACRSTEKGKEAISEDEEIEKTKSDSIRVAPDHSPNKDILKEKKTAKAKLKKKKDKG